MATDGFCILCQEWWKRGKRIGKVSVAMDMICIEFMRTPPRVRMRPHDGIDIVARVARCHLALAGPEINSNDHSSHKLFNIANWHDWNIFDLIWFWLKDNGDLTSASTLKRLSDLVKSILGFKVRAICIKALLQNWVFFLVFTFFFA